MPWFEPNGWHWKMNKPLPAGRVASHYLPLIGVYDSADRKVLELQIQWMKLAGVDGVIADWYGTHNWYDYPMIHKRTELLFQVAEKAGLKVCVMFEDQTVKNAIKGSLADPNNTVQYAREDGSWLAPWVKRPSWLKLKQKPVIFVFGPQFFEKPERDAFLTAAGSPVLISEHQQVPSAGGAFDWPVPSQGLKFTFDFPARSANWGIRVPCAFPRFKDFYKLGGSGEGYGELPDDDGNTYKETLSRGMRSGADAVQIVTWNDWGEGTQIEPSREFSLRDLVATQEARRNVDASFKYSKADLSLPWKLYEKRQKGDSASLREASRKLMEGNVSAAKGLISAP